TAALPDAARVSVAERESSDSGRSQPQPVPTRPASGTGGRLARLLNVPAWPAPAAGAVCCLLLALILWMDVATGADVQLSPFYFLPIIVASLRFQAPGGLLVAGA